MNKKQKIWALLYEEDNIFEFDITLEYGVGSLYFRTDRYTVLAGNCEIETISTSSIPTTVETVRFKNFETSVLIYRKIYDETNDVYEEQLYFYDLSNKTLAVYEREF